MREADEPLALAAARLRPSAEQPHDAVAQLRGWRLCWELAVVAGELEEAQRLAHSLSEWLRLRNEDPHGRPDIVAVDAALGRRHSD